MASGMPSRRWQIWAMAGALSSVDRERRVGPGVPGRRTARTASYCDSVGTASATSGGGAAQRGHPPGDLAGHAERLAAGGQDRDATAPASEQGVDDLGAGVDQVLAVVEHEQRGFVAQRAPRGARSRSTPGISCTPSAARAVADHGRGVGHAAQLDQPDAAGIAVEHLGGDGHRHAGLADTARSGERDQPVGGTVDRRPRAPPGPGRSSGVSWTGRLWRYASSERSGRKHGGEVGMRELPHPLGPTQVLQAMGTEIEQADLLRQAVDHQAAVASDTRTCPPCPIARRRAQRITACPK